MSSRTAGGFRDGRRGQAAVVGLVLLVGLVAVLSVGILLAGTGANDETQQDVTEAKVEQAFLEMDATVDSVARREPGSVRRFAIDLPEDDGVVRRETAGRVVIERKNLTDTETVVVKDIGAVVYESDDGSIHYAYQGGAVWKGEGNSTRMVSAPSLVYETDRRGAAPTFTLPITDLRGSTALGSGDVDVRKRDTRAPLNDVTTVENQLVTVTIESDYYVGWGEYFENRYRNAVVTYDHPNSTTVIELGKRDIDGEFDAAIRAGNDVNVGTGSPATEGPVVAGGTVTGSGIDCSDTNVTCGSTPAAAPLDAVVDSKIEEADSEYADASAVTENGGSLPAGDYYTDGFELDSGETLTLDLSNGNLTLVVDGPVGIAGGRIEVTDADQNDTCCYARLYVGDSSDNGRGDWAMATGTASVATTNDNATRFQVYGTSEMHFHFGQSNGVGFNGVVYAPHDGDPATGSNAAIATYGLNSARCSPPSGADACIGTGNGEFDGALIGFHDAAVRQSSRVEYDEALATVEPTLEYSGVIPPPITFLHVSVHDVCIGSDPCPATPTSTATSTPGPGPTPTTSPTSTPTTVSAALDVTQTASGGFSEYQLDASGSTPAGDIEEYRWDFDSDGTVDAVTSAPVTTVSCGNPGQDYASCAALGQATVNTVDTDGGDSDTATEPYP